MKNCFLIINYNDAKSTNHLINNIKDFKIIDHILIIDNNSNTKDLEKLQEIKNKKIEIIELEKNIGYSGAINYGAKYLINKYKNVNLIVSNSDIVIVSEEDIKRMLDLLNNELIGLVGPQILERGIINRGCKSISPKKDFLLGVPIINGLIEDKYLYYSDNYYDNEISSVDVISSCFFMISGELLKKINYLDENIFLYYEDFVLSKKVKESGKLVVISNKVKIKHLYSSSIEKIISKKDKYEMFKKSQYYYHVKYNHATRFDRFLIKMSTYLGLTFKSFYRKRK